MAYTSVASRKAGTATAAGYSSVASKKRNEDRLNLIPVSQRRKAVIPTTEQIASRKETIQSGPEKRIRDYLPAALREGLFGKGQIEKIDGSLGYDRGLIGFVAPPLTRDRTEQIINRANALEGVGTKTNDAYAKAIQDVGAPRKSIQEMARRPLPAPEGLPKLALSPEEKKALRWIGPLEKLDTALLALDAVGIGSIRRVATKTLIETVSKLDDAKKIEEVLLSQGVDAKLASEYGVTLAPIKDEKKVAEGLASLERAQNTIPESLRPLAEEAKKYKSAEEFVERETISQVNWEKGSFEVSLPGAKGTKTVATFNDLTPAVRQELIEARKALDEAKGTGIENTKPAGDRYFAAEKAAKEDIGRTSTQLTDLYTQATKADEVTPVATSGTSLETPASVPTTLQKTLVQTPEGQSQRVLLDTSQAQSTQSGPVQSLDETLPQKAAVVESKVGTPVSPATYQANRGNTTSRLSQIKESFKNTFKSGAKGADILLGTISTRLKNIDPSLKTAIRKYEYNLGQAIQQSRREVQPFLQKLKKSRVTVGDYADLDLALKNGDAAKTKEVLEKYGLTEDFKAVQKTLDSLYERAKAVGYDIGYRENYFPRTIKDSEGLLEHLQKGDDWSLIDEAIKGKETQIGRYLSVDEKASLINSLVRGYGGKIQLSETGAMKARQIDLVDADLNKFYDDSMGSLMTYMDNTNDAIEARKFFGKSGKGEEFGNIEDSIGAFILDLLVKGKIKPSQEKELTKILRARFNEIGTSGFTQAYKNLAYIDTMGSPISAITQIGDFAFSIYNAGPLRTIAALSRAVAGKSKITRADIGIEKIAQEFSDRTKLGAAVDLVFKATGLNKLDTLGKETLINATMSKLKSRASKPNAEFYKKLEDVFGDDPEAVARVIEDLKAGRVTEDTKLLAFNELLNFQPAALSEMPEQYLKGGNGRIFYMLKTYTVKLYDVYRNEVLSNLGKGDRVKAIRNLTALTASLVAANATADEIKDFVLGRETKLSDRVVDNLLKLAGFSKYTIYKAREEGIGSAMARSILPPFKFIDSLFKDIARGNEVNELETIESIPIGGKLYYWWFGKGASKSETKRENASVSKPGPANTIPGLPKLPSSGVGKLPAPPGLPALP